MQTKNRLLEVETREVKSILGRPVWFFKKGEQKATGTSYQVPASSALAKFLVKPRCVPSKYSTFKKFSWFSQTFVIEFYAEVIV